MNDLATAIAECRAGIRDAADGTPERLRPALARSFYNCKVTSHGTDSAGEWWEVESMAEVHRG